MNQTSTKNFKFLFRYHIDAKENTANKLNQTVEQHD